MPLGDYRQIDVVIERLRARGFAITLAEASALLSGENVLMLGAIPTTKIEGRLVDRLFPNGYFEYDE